MERPPQERFSRVLTEILMGNTKTEGKPTDVGATMVKSQRFVTQECLSKEEAFSHLFTMLFRQALCGVAREIEGPLGPVISLPGVFRGCEHPVFVDFDDCPVVYPVDHRGCYQASCSVVRFRS